MGKGILKDFWIKLISVAIAIALWFYVNSGKPRNITLNAPLFVAVASSGVVVKEISPAKVKVTFCATLSKILFLNPKTIKLNLPLTVNKNDAEIPCEISSKDVIVPPGVEVVKIEPARVTVKLEQSKK